MGGWVVGGCLGVWGVEGGRGRERGVSDVKGERQMGDLRGREGAQKTGRERGGWGKS